MRKSTCLLPKLIFTLACGLTLSVSQQEIAFAQGDVIPATSQSGGFFNRQLGTALRFNYHTQGYGTQDDVFSLGGMKVFNMDGATAFLDGQGTLSDDFGGGFNLGAGYRQLATLGTSFDPQRIMGASFWTDGQSSANDNFFTQLGFSLESLGDAYDVRFSGYFPLSRTKTGDAELTGTGDPFFSGNNIFGATQSFGVDTALDVLDGELAFRIQDLEAWAFAGAYYVGGGADDTAGYRAGARGYALPDLAVSLSVTDDDIYDTNVMFGITWFIGRTHKGNAPCGTLLDRFREPVIRNDFIAMETSRVSQQSGDALTSPTDNEAIRIVHVDSNDGTNVAGGGDGTFENPFADISDIDAIANPGSSMDGDIILVHGGSTVTGTATLQANQSVLGEGVDQDMNRIPHIIATNELGNINLPETATGSLDLARPITTSAGTPFTLADNNTINNFTINNAATAVLADTVTTPTLQNLQINDATTGLTLRDITGTTLVENTVQINRATTRAIDVDQGADGMSIAAAINDSVGQSLVVQNRLGGTIDFTGTINDQADIDGDMVVTESQGVLIQNNTDTTVNFSNTNDIHVAGTDTGIQIINNATTTVNASGLTDITASGDADGLVVANTDTGSTVTFADLNATAADGNTVDVQNAGTVTISSPSSTVADPRGIANTGTGNALFNEGNLADADRNATLIVNSNITNAGGGQAVNIINRSANDVTINGTVDVDDMMSGGVFAQGNVDGNIIFTNTLTLDTGTSNAVLLQNNADLGMGTTATISFTDLNIDTTTGDGFTATGGGNLIVTSTNGTNTIDVVGTGTALNLDGMTIDPANVTFDVVNADGSATGIILRDLDGTGQVLLGGGANVGDGGILMTTGQAITIDNVTNAALTNLQIDNSLVADTGAGLLVTNQMTGSSLTFGALDVDTSGALAHAVNVATNQDGTITFNTLTADTTGTGDAVRLSNNLDATVIINDMAITTTGGGTGFNAVTSGNVSVLGTNSVDTTGGSGVVIQDQTVVGGATFQTVNVAGGTNGVQLVNVGGGNVTIGTGTTVGDGGTLATTGTAIEVNNVANTSLTNMLVDNDAAPNEGQGVFVTNQDTGSTATFNTLAVRGTSNTGVNVSGNQDGTVIFNDLETTTTSGTAVSVVNNNNATTSFNNMDLTTTSGLALNASGTGTLVATRTGTNTNSIATTSGQAISMLNTEIGGAGFTVDTVNVAAGTGAGVGLTNVSGGAVVLGSGANAGDGGTIATNAAANTMSVNDVENLTVNNVTVTNAGAGGGLSVTNQAAGSDANFDTLTATAVDGDAVNVSGNVDGTIDFTDLDASTSGAGGAVVVSNNASATVSINGMTASATGTGGGFSATGTGNLAVTGTTSVDTATGKVLEIVGQNISANSNIDTVNSSGTVEGIAIELRDVTGSTLTVGSGTNAGDGGTITSQDTVGPDEDHAILVDNVASLDMNNITVNNAATNGRAIEVRNNTGGTRTFDGMTATTGLLAGANVDVHDNSGGTTTFNDLTADSSAGGAHAVRIRDNTGGTINVATATVTSAAGDGFLIDNNSGATVTASNFAVTTTGGTGFNANGGGNLTTSDTNTIDTTTGVGLNIDGMNIATSALFSSVDVANGASNGIVLTNLTGGQVRVGAASASGTDGAAGTLNTAQTSIIVTGVTNALFNDVTTSTAGAFNGVNVTHTSGTDALVVFNNLTHTTTGTGDAVVVTDNGTGELDFTLQDANIDVQAANSRGFNLITGNNTGEIDIRLNDNVILAGDNNAVFADVTTGTGDIQFLVNGGNDWTNDSAANATASFVVSTDRTLNATIGDRIGNAPFDENRFNNVNAGGTAVSLVSNSAAGSLNLDLRGNTAVGGTTDFILTETLGTFGVVDRAATITAETNNSGVVDLGGGGVEADFDDPAAIKQVD